MTQLILLLSMFRGEYSHYKVLHEQYFIIKSSDTYVVIQSIISTRYMHFQKLIINNKQVFIAVQAIYSFYLLEKL